MSMVYLTLVIQPWQRPVAHDPIQKKKRQMSLKSENLFYNILIIKELLAQILQILSLPQKTPD